MKNLEYHPEKGIIHLEDDCLCSIKITHGKGEKQEINARSIKKTEKEFKQYLDYRAEEYTSRFLKLNRQFLACLQGLLKYRIRDQQRDFQV